MLTAASGLIVRVSGDGLIITDARDDREFVLDASGALIWRALLGGESVEGAVRKLRDSEFDVDDAMLQRDVAEFADSLVQAGLLVELSG